MSNRALQNFAHGPGGVKVDPDNDATAAAANEARDNEIGELKAEIETLAKKNEGILYAASRLGVLIGPHSNSVNPIQFNEWELGLIPTQL